VECSLVIWWDGVWVGEQGASGFHRDGKESLQQCHPACWELERAAA